MTGPEHYAEAERLLALAERHSSAAVPLTALNGLCPWPPRRYTPPSHSPPPPREAQQGLTAAHGPTSPRQGSASACRKPLMPEARNPVPHRGPRPSSRHRRNPGCAIRRNRHADGSRPVAFAHARERAQPARPVRPARRPDRRPRTRRHRRAPAEPRQPVPARRVQTDSRPPAHEVKITGTNPDSHSVHTEQHQPGGPDHYVVNYDVWNHRNSLTFAKIVRTDQAE